MAERAGRGLVLLVLPALRMMPAYLTRFSLERIKEFVGLASDKLQMQNHPRISN